MKGDSLGDRMKQYERVPKQFLTRRMPAIIRLDGKSFHSFTKGMKRPFDKVMVNTMWDTSIALCSQIQGVKVAYVQSDEISLLLTDYETITTDAWYDKNVQKMVSVSASIATLAFNKCFMENDVDKEYESKYFKANFDSRVFLLPQEEVNNYFLWRQQDATRNAIQGLGQINFSHKELQGASCDEIQKMLSEKGISFLDCSIPQKRGACIIKETYKKNDADRTRWIVDQNIPIFSDSQGYIGKYV